jgi:hypothetical protein
MSIDYTVSGRCGKSADASDSSATDSDVAAIPRRSGAIDYVRVSNNNVKLLGFRRRKKDQQQDCKTAG